EQLFVLSTNCYFESGCHVHVKLFVSKRIHKTGKNPRRSLELRPVNGNRLTPYNMGLITQIVKNGTQIFSFVQFGDFNYGKIARLERWMGNCLPRNVFDYCTEQLFIPPIIFIGTHSIALVETDSAKLCFLNRKMRAMDGFPTIDTSREKALDDFHRQKSMYVRPRIELELTALLVRWLGHQLPCNG
ncbi:hypothetical protein SFRURICE_020190, partial [Spodoptera frugiperda]